METISNPNEASHAKKLCTICKCKELTGRQTKFCSRRCHNQSNNSKHQNYQCQQKRGLARKLKLVKDFGGKCETCGYCKNLAALSFHHKDPCKKSFPLDLRRLSNNNWKNIMAEAKKCQLLCIRCHTELHNPNFCLEKLLSSPLL